MVKRMMQECRISDDAQNGTVGTSTKYEEVDWNCSHIRSNRQFKLYLDEKQPLAYDERGNKKTTNLRDCHRRQYDFNALISLYRTWTLN